MSTTTKLSLETDRRLTVRSEEHTSELQSRQYLVCRLLLEKKINLVQNQTTYNGDPDCSACPTCRSLWRRCLYPSPQHRSRYRIKRHVAILASESPCLFCIA